MVKLKSKRVSRMLRCLSCGNCMNFVIKGFSIFIYELVRFIVEKTHIQAEAFVLSPFIEGKTLSIGCGNGSVEALINKGIVGVEVLKYGNPRIPIKIYNGKKLPFKNNCFDTVMIAYVFHHVRNEEQIHGILKEALRVSKKKIIVLEQIYKNKIQLLILKFFDFICNKPFRVPTPFNFFTVKTWIIFFRSLKFNFKIFTLKIPLLSILFVIPVGKWKRDNACQN